MGMECLITENFATWFAVCLKKAISTSIQSAWASTHNFRWTIYLAKRILELWVCNFCSNVSYYRLVVVLLYVRSLIWRLFMYTIGYTSDGIATRTRRATRRWNNERSTRPRHSHAIRTVNRRRWQVRSVRAPKIYCGPMYINGVRLFRSRFRCSFYIWSCLHYKHTMWLRWC